MSDFDKEAERERLREKYEEDKEKRAATEQMSELLLQGATMTNAHCSQCGNPIFRFDGQEFCATCEQAVDRGRDGESDSAAENGANGIEVTTPSDETRVVFGQDGDSAASNRSTEDRAADDGSTEERAPDGRRTQTQVRDGATRHTPTDPTSAADRDRSGGRTEGSGIDDARIALVETLVRFSERAAESDDPRQAKAHLEAAREAAETLAALQ